MEYWPRDVTPSALVAAVEAAGFDAAVRARGRVTTEAAPGGSTQLRLRVRSLFSTHTHALQTGEALLRLRAAVCGSPTGDRHDVLRVLGRRGERAAARARRAGAPRSPRDLSTAR